MSKTSVNYKIFLIEAIVTTKKDLFPLIDFFYEKYKYEAYKAAKNSKWYSHPIFCSSGIDKQIYSRKLLGLFNLAEHDSNVSQDMIELIKKGWKNIYYYVTKLKKLSLQKYLDKIYYADINVDYLNAICVIMITLANSFQIPIEKDEAYIAFCQMIQDRLNFHNNKHLQKFNYKTTSSEIQQKAKQIKNRIFQTYGEMYSTDDLLNLNKVENSIIDKYAMNMLVLYETEELVLDDYDHSLSDEDLEEICALYWIIHKNQNLEQSAKFLINGILLKYTQKEFKKVKEYYFKNHKETLFFDIQEKDNKLTELQNQNKQLIKQNETLLAELHNLKSEHKKRYEQEIFSLKSQIEKLEARITKLQENKQELFKLREYIFQQSQEKNEFDSASEEYIIVPEINAVIVGGYDKWRERLKEKLPETFKFISGNQENFDIQILENIDYVFFNIVNMSHAVYYKVIKFCNRKNIKYYFLQNSNIELVNKNILKLIKD